MAVQTHSPTHLSILLSHQPLSVYIIYLEIRGVVDGALRQTYWLPQAQGGMLKKRKKKEKMRVKLMFLINCRWGLFTR